jgi:hypothetical protein
MRCFFIWNWEFYNELINDHCENNYFN